MNVPRTNEAPPWQYGIRQFRAGLCQLWVISDRAGRRHTTVHVRFTPKADKQQTFRYVRFVPIATERTAKKKALLFDHLVGAGQ
jgi:hypothetical protein